MAGPGVLATLQHNGPLTGHRQNQGRKNSGRAEANDHRPFFSARPELGGPITLDRGWGHPLVPAFFEDLALPAFEGHIHRINDSDIRFFPGVHGTAGNLKGPDLRRRDPQGSGCLIHQGPLILARIHGNISYSKHCFLPPRHFVRPIFRSSRPTEDCSRRSPRLHPAPRHRHRVPERACFPMWCCQIPGLQCLRR